MRNTRQKVLIVLRDLQYIFWFQYFVCVLYINHLSIQLLSFSIYCLNCIAIAHHLLS